jgi:hypothetical protein
VTTAKRYIVIAAAAAVTAWALLSAPAAQAATPQCGDDCAALYTLLDGPADVVAVAGASGTTAHVGQPVALLHASSGNQGEDWFLVDEGTVSDFFAAGLGGSGLNLHYGNDEVYEYNYAPRGVFTDFCLGVPGIATNGDPVSLRACGETASTLWVADTADQVQRDVPFINGTDTNFSNPYVLTASTVGATMATRSLTGVNGVINDGQYWSTLFGVLS